MNVRPMEVGDRVAIRLSSFCYGLDDNDNPADKPGKVIRKSFGRYIVRWEHSGQHNGYARSDLKYWKGKVPKRAPAPAPELKTKEELLTICKDAMEACKRKDQDVTARYAFIYNTGNVEVNRNTACHATVLCLDAAVKRTIGYIVTCINRGRAGDCDAEVAINYYDWLLNRSPYASAFVTKDARKAYEEDRYVICTTSVPANMLQAALVATRQTWEHNNVCYVQKMMEERGVDGNTAHLLGCLLGKISKSSKNLAPCIQGAGHFHLDMHGMDAKSCRRFVENKPLNLNPHYDEGGGARGVHLMFYPKRNSNFSTLKYIKDYINKVGAGEGELITNPFAKAKRAEKTVVCADKLAKHVLTKGIFV